jgi:hypothetical protein
MEISLHPVLWLYALVVSHCLRGKLRVIRDIRASQRLIVQLLPIVVFVRFLERHLFAGTFSQEEPLHHIRFILGRVPGILRFYRLSAVLVTRKQNGIRGPKLFIAYVIISTGRRFDREGLRFTLVLLGRRTSKRCSHEVVQGKRSQTTRLLPQLVRSG